MIEDHFLEPSTGISVSVSLCLGGNDFLPKFHGISHKKWIETILNIPGCLSGLLVSIEGQLQVNETLYLQLVQKLYCSPTLDSEKLSLDDVWQLSVKTPGKDFRNPNQWMPPRTALQQIVKLINCQISYFLTTWDHEANLPNFIATGCLVKHGNEIEYNLGPEVHCEEVTSLLKKSDEEILCVVRQARKLRKKRPCPETPDKQLRMKPLVSTPRRRRTLIPVAVDVTEDFSDIEPMPELSDIEPSGDSDDLIDDD